MTILVRMNVVAQCLADVFYLPPGTRNKKTLQPMDINSGKNNYR